MADSDLTKTEIIIPYGGDDYVFKIPGLMDDMRVGVRARNIRRQADPNDPGEFGLSDEVVLQVRAMASFEELLRKGPRWPWIADAQGKPLVDSLKFPDDRAGDVTAIYLLFLQQVNSFRLGRDTNGGQAGTEAVAGQPGTGDEPVQS